MNTELKKWKEEMNKSFEWYTGMVERIQSERKRERERGVVNVSVELYLSILVPRYQSYVMAFKQKLSELQNISNPNIKECKRTKKSLEESFKHRIKEWELVIKHYLDIQDGTLAGRFGAAAVTMAATKAEEKLKESLQEFHKMSNE